jgi:predicted nucleic acid-binding protein
MSWLVDTCVLLDVIDGDSEFAVSSAETLDSLASEGLEISPVTAVELAPAFLEMPIARSLSSGITAYPFRICGMPSRNARRRRPGRRM